MPCIDNAEPNQTEVQFLQELLHNHKVITRCCGPITTIGFTGLGWDMLKAAIRSSGVETTYLDSFDGGMIDSSAYLSVAMCARHWIMNSLVVGAQGLIVNNSDWNDLATYIFRLVCMDNGWDHKEVINFVRTYNNVRKSVD